MLKLRYIGLLGIVLLMAGRLFAATPTTFRGVVVEKGSGETLPFVQIYFTGTQIGTTSDMDGNFSLSNSRGLINVSVEMVGYKTQNITLKPGRDNVKRIVMEPEVYALSEFVVKPTRKREHYRRRGNPAVELIKNVIANKDKNRIGGTETYKKRTYEKLLMALEPFDYNLDRKFWRQFKFLENYLDTMYIERGVLIVDSGKVQVDTIRLGEDSLYIRVDSVVIRTDEQKLEENKTTVLNFSLRETIADEYYQYSPRKENKVITAQRWEGLDNLFDNGGMTTNLQAMFQTINIFDNNINLMLCRFVSPLSSSLAVTFYHYYIQDTVLIEGTKCVDLIFVPVNSESFGFTGHLYITADSTYALKKYSINVPQMINLNWLSHMSISETFYQLESGKWASEEVCTDVRFALRKKAKHNIYARQIRHYDRYETNMTIPKNLFYMSGAEVTLDGAKKIPKAVWDTLRPLQLTAKETLVDSLETEMMRVPAFRSIVNTVEDLIQEYIPTTKVRNASKWDFGPIFNTISYNEQEGVRLRVGGMTTANQNPHWFTSLYAAYGFKDQRAKGGITALYSFNEKEYHPYQTLRHYLALTLSYDLEEFGQTYRVLDRDHIFMSIKFNFDPKPMQYIAKLRLKYEKEYANQFSIITWFDFMYNLPNGSSGAGNPKWAAPRFGENRKNKNPLLLQYIKRNADGTVTETPFYHDAMWTFSLRYSPGGYIYNDRQGIESPFNLWKDAPVFRFVNEMGYILEDRFFYNRMQFTAEKRFWLSAFGHLDVIGDIGYLATKKAPYTKLFVPVSNQSILMDPKAFSLMQPMEFLMDRFVSVHMTYYMKGWLFNRIPGIKHLKLREIISFHALAGYLGDRNNPYKTDGLYEFPVSHMTPQTDEKGNTVGWNSVYARPDFAQYNDKGEIKYSYMPYMELTAGIENIFKLFRVEYVRRLTHLYAPGTGAKLGPWQRNGIRITVRVSM